MTHGEVGKALWTLRKGTLIEHHESLQGLHDWRCDSSGKSHESHQVWKNIPAGENCVQMLCMTSQDLRKSQSRKSWKRLSMWQKWWVGKEFQGMDLRNIFWEMKKQKKGKKLRCIPIRLHVPVCLPPRGLPYRLCHSKDGKTNPSSSLSSPLDHTTQRWQDFVMIHVHSVKSKHSFMPYS